MTRDQLEHCIRAAATIADDDELIVLGSQAILGRYPGAPRALLASMEVDLYPKNHPERADLIDGTIGELSPFHDLWGYYAQGVGPETAVLAPGWEARLVPVQGPGTRQATGWCLEPNDLVVAKLVAGRDKDFDYARVALQHGLVRVRMLRERVSALPVSEAVRGLVLTRLNRVTQAL
jgi:hypothetical protein